MTFKFLRKFAAEHPISWSVIVESFFVYTLLSLLLVLAARFGFNAKQIEAIIGENMAPKTFELFGSIVLIFLSFRAIILGPSGLPDGRVARIFSVTFPNTALSIQTAIAALALGSSCATAIPGGSILNAGFPPQWSQVFESIGILVFAYLMFISLTISKTTAPGYLTPWFPKYYRILAGLLLLVVLLRTVTLLLYLARASLNEP